MKPAQADRIHRKLMRPGGDHLQVDHAMAEEKSWVRDLERLSALHQKGKLGDKEFAKAKAKLLALNPEEIARRAALEQQAIKDVQEGLETAELKVFYYRGCLTMLAVSIAITLLVTWCGSGP